ncbi:hypothetical protein N9A15_04780 [Candidatus Pelagibacter sp.]|mgnify:FL=1|jgi:hypothetical protein|nr:hypothetical protein [Candidatus Pelagibacter sp.]|tara:strand:+ start:201 stop:962 length:762 start_codon:yes stop_codon:yes gene_type:complete
MNFFFGFKNNNYVSEIQIPKFQNRNFTDKQINLYRADILGSFWEIDQVSGSEEDDYFYFLKDQLIDNKVIFFLAKESEIKSSKEKKLLKYNKYTETSPAFRANFIIKKKDGGFSSYQSEYPFNMAVKNGSVVSGVSSLTNINANKNYIIFRNIFIDPIEKPFEVFFINIKTNKILKRKQFYTNRTNILEIEDELLLPEIYFVSQNYLGVPIYLSEKNGHLSFEHTHPPHEYFMSDNKFKIIKKFKNKINEIIS